MGNVRAWEQLPNEPAEAYARFLIYRNLGMGRSVTSAYNVAAKSGEKRRSGQWERDSLKFKWQERASNWDSWQLANVVPEATTAIFKLIEQAAKVSLEQLLSGNVKPANFTELREMVVILAGFISPEVITATIDNAPNVGDERTPNSND